MVDLDSIREFFPEEEAREMARHMEGAMSSSYLSGGTGAMRDLGVKGTFKVVDKASLAFFRNYSLVLSTKETAATIDNMKSMIFSGLKEGKDIDVIARQLRTSGLSPFAKSVASPAEMARIVKWRARMVARTECLRASNVGRMYQYKAHGVKHVQWLVGPKPCPLCGDYEGRVYPLNDAPVPPLHPNCVCTVSSITATPKGEAKEPFYANETKVRGYHEDLWRKSRQNGNEHMTWFNDKKPVTVMGTRSKITMQKLIPNQDAFNRVVHGTIHTHPGMGGPPSPADVHVLLYHKNMRYMGVRSKNFFYEMTKGADCTSGLGPASGAKAYYDKLVARTLHNMEDYLKAWSVTCKRYNITMRIKELEGVPWFG